MEFAHALHEWSDFYLLVGTAGATLVALLFVAVSLGVGFLTQARAAATRVFYSPIIVHFTAVFFISAVALVPAHSPTFFAMLIGASALCGIAVSAFTTIQLLRNHWTDYLQDHIGYGLLPLAGYVALIAAAVMIFTQHAEALDVLAGALLLLLIINIRNAWDLTLSMVRRHGDNKQS
ncbi:MAG TPA: hypothetical protein VMI47_08730 [Pseudolabrys sp.]|nr:hypothetical protein [Pseudolabrys sp.]